MTAFLPLKKKPASTEKHLRAIEAGRPVKETTLQSIADKLRVPMAHLVGSSAIESHDVVYPRNQYREFKLQRLDAAALRKLAGENNDINWILKFDQISEDLEKLLLKLREGLNGWFFQLQFADDEAGDNLISQISHIKRSVDIDKCVEELEQRDFKILGGTYLAWDGHYGARFLRYLSHLVIALAIVPKSDNNSTVRVLIGPEPPQEFGDDQPARIDFIFVDGVLRWSRKTEFTAEDHCGANVCF